MFRIFQEYWATYKNFRLNPWDDYMEVKQNKETWDRFPELNPIMISDWL